ncbi:MAG: hypothetical protein GAK43_01925 [Stenotrophomonas maltophilia]|nr:MAG: hypothetical protein GAK43_01925 [Stenotrophomonas maltophilia]
MRLLRLCLPLFLSVAAVPVFATDYAAIEDKCREAAPQQLDNSVVMGCADEASAAAKKDMNRVYQQTYKLLQAQGDEHAEGFEKAQKAWLQYREAWCDSQGFSIGTPNYSLCRMQQNTARVAELNDFYRQVQPN